MNWSDTSLALTGTYSHRLNAGQKAGLAVAGGGMLSLLVATAGYTYANAPLVLGLSLALLVSGTLGYAVATYRGLPEGIKNNGVWLHSLTAKGAAGWVAAVLLTGFYVLLYWFPAWLGLGSEGAANTGIVALFDPLSVALKGSAASQWFVYGTLYTVAILAMGVKFIAKYRHNRYQIFRTLSVMFFQLGFAFLLPEVLQKLRYPYYDFKNMWPLNYYFFDEWNIKGLLASGNIGLLMLVWGMAMILVISPVLTYFYGKRWYCSWVCGCGGLAETAGDPFRHLSDKSLKAWQVERWLIYGVLALAVVMTVAVVYGVLHNNPQGFWLTKPFFVLVLLAMLGFGAALLRWQPSLFATLDKKILPYIYGIGGAIALFTVVALATGASNVFFIDSYQLRSWYGFAIGAAFSGVIGVGFYPIMGSRVWCRFGCPMAAILGIQQKFFSRFRITTNGGQCISCGNCSTYCEMGIDVRAYAQKGQDIVRASCVGCGICAAVCPRGVLRLENGSLDLTTRATELRAIHIENGKISLPM